jgi:perosamine synthetase
LIPVSEPLLGGREEEYVLDCLRSGWISSAGPYLEAFESQWAAACGMQHGIAMANGSVALAAAVAALQLPPGSQVLLPTFTIISCAWAVIEAGLEPVLVDSDADTWTMDVRLAEQSASARTKAVMPVHMYGHPVDMAPLLELAEAHRWLVVEDAAEAHGARCYERPCGSFGDVSCFSFYANKIITTGEGGMVLTRSAKIAERLRSLRNLGFRRDRRFYHTEHGHNYRLTNLQAAIGLAQVERLDDHVARKRRMALAYAEGLRGLPVQLPVERGWARNVYWMYGIVLDDAVPLDAMGLAAKLAGRGIETRPFFVGMHEQPVFHGLGLFRGECHPVAERLARRGLYLPSGLTLTQQQISEVCEAVRAALGSG